MKHFLIVGCGFLFAATCALAAEVTCYNDDSQDVVNQDELRWSPWGGPSEIPDPADCAQGPAVTIGGSRYSTHPIVSVDGRKVYDDGFDPAVEARVAPSGAVAILTTRGSLYLYKDGALRLWYSAGFRGVEKFRMARDGSLLAAARDGGLIINGRVQGTITTVQKLYSSRSGRVVALMSDGSVVDAEGSLYRASGNPAAAVKIAANGVVVWLTQDGNIGSTQDSYLYWRHSDAAASFKLNPEGRVAFVTRQGRLHRDRDTLSSGLATIARYKIHRNGSISAMDSDGRALFFE